MINKKNKLDEFHYHEVLDRTYMINEIIENFLINHLVIKKHKKIKNDIEKAQDILYGVYQEIGKLMIKNDDVGMLKESDDND
jgi:hypothetical protein